jgi:hypothetical protein
MAGMLEEEVMKFTEEEHRVRLFRPFRAQD